MKESLLPQRSLKSSLSKRGGWKFPKLRTKNSYFGVNQVRYCCKLAWKNLVFILMASVFITATTSGFSQTVDDESRIRKFVNGAGEMLYFFAWPSATYQSVNFNDFSREPGGFDASITLHGTSAIDGGDLWTKLVLEARDGKISNIRWGENNAILFKPGESVAAFGKLLVELNKQYAESNSGNYAASEQSPVILSAICVSNPTNGKLPYILDWSGRRDVATLESGTAKLYLGDSSTDFLLTFNDSFSAAYTPRTIRLTGSEISVKPTKCADVAVYEFQVQENMIGLSPQQWRPGFEAPFSPAFVRGAQEGSWLCAQGYKRIQASEKSFDCISNATGLIGVALTTDPGIPFPRIANIVAGGPADRGGLTVGLFLTSVDDTSTKNLPLNDIVHLLRGGVGTSVRISVMSLDNLKQTLSLIRQ